LLVASEAELVCPVERHGGLWWCLKERRLGIGKRGQQL